eukprot:6492568-Amphidinium_carterae.3
MLGEPAGAALRVAERRWTFAQRGAPGPDDSPFQAHSFSPSVDYGGVDWGSPVPQAECTWERRVYVELNLATDRRYAFGGKGAHPVCHACRRVGSRTVPLAIYISACAVTTGLANDTWWHQPAWPESTPCAPTIRAWKSGRTQSETFRTLATIGSVAFGAHRYSLENRLSIVPEGHRGGQENRHHFTTSCTDTECASPCLGYRQEGWIPPTRRIGEARKPGPSICSANPGGWSRIDGTLNLKHDIVAVQETFVLRDQMSSARFTADKLGYYSSFTPARKTDGRPGGGLKPTGGPVGVWPCFVATPSRSNVWRK